MIPIRMRTQVHNNLRIKMDSQLCRITGEIGTPSSKTVEATPQHPQATIHTGEAMDLVLEEIDRGIRNLGAVGHLRETSATAETATAVEEEEDEDEGVPSAHGHPVISDTALTIDPSVIREEVVAILIQSPHRYISTFFPIQHNTNGN